jgi:hypothetical protein
VLSATNEAAIAYLLTADIYDTGFQGSGWTADGFFHSTPSVVTGSGSEHQIVSTPGTSLTGTGTAAGGSGVAAWCVTFMAGTAAAQTPYQPYFQQMLASRRKAFVGWREGYDHRWRRHRGLIVPTRKIIGRAA